MGGQRSEFNHFTLDGVENTDPAYNSYIFLPSIDALQEFKIQTGIYPAEFGREASQVNVSTKSGTNQFHGTLFEFLRNQVMDAKTYSFVKEVPKTPFKWNQYGYTFGGPVWIPKLYDGRNRLFFFSNWEGFREREDLQGIYSVPTAAMRAGNFTGITTIYDPTTRMQQSNGTITATPFANDTIPASMINPISVKLLQFIPLPNVNTSGINSNLQENNPLVINNDQITERIDFVESTKSTWFGRYSWSNESQNPGGHRGGPRPPTC